MALVENERESAKNDFTMIPYIPLEEYSKKFEQVFKFKREDGILEMRVHYKGGEQNWDVLTHDAWGKALRMVAQDRENEVLIITGTGKRWIREVTEDNEFGPYMMDNLQNDHVEYCMSTYEHWYLEGRDLLRPLIYDMPIPTICALNGPSKGHTEFPLVCDITLATPDVVFWEPHFSDLGGTVTGDGVFLVYQECFGTKLANDMVMLGRKVSAQQAYELGAVAEICERDQILERAWEIARFLRTRGSYNCRIQHELMVAPWRRKLAQDADFHWAAENWGTCITDPKHVMNAVEGLMKNENV